MAGVLTGLERLVSEDSGLLGGKRIGLLANQASVDRRLNHAKRLVHSVKGVELAALFGPQHGFEGTEQADMIETGHGVDGELGVPVFSLYGETRIPTAEMLEGLDAVVVDLQDVGTRVYTFASTLTYLMEEAGKRGVEVVVLDRPNPVGGLVMEGPVLDPGAASFVGLHPVPLRHGLTLGEMARMISGEFGAACELTVVPMKGWTREMLFRDTGLSWVAPSPNLPAAETCLLYCGFVILEGANLSEGRGTTLPFHLFGAPWLHRERLERALKQENLPGAIFRATSFRPTFDKWEGEVCRGFQVHVTDEKEFRPVKTALAVIKGVMLAHPEDFSWKAPPYEYEFERAPIDLIMGLTGSSHTLAQCKSARDLVLSWEKELEAFRDRARPYLIY